MDKQGQPFDVLRWILSTCLHCLRGALNTIRIYSVQRSGEARPKHPNACAEPAESPKPNQPNKLINQSRDLPRLEISATPSSAMVKLISHKLFQVTAQSELRVVLRFRIS